MKNFFDTLKTVFENKKYLYTSLVVAIVSFGVFYKLTLFSIANNSLKIYIMMSGYNYTYFTLLSFAIISLLFGIYFSLILYKFNLTKKQRKTGIIGGFFGFIGFIIGSFAAGCPTCGAFLLGLFGAPLALMYLPYDGMELRILSILILGTSIYFMTKSLSKCKDCEIQEI